MKQKLESIRLFFIKYSNIIKIIVSITILLFIFQKVDFGASISVISKLGFQIIAVLALTTAFQFATQMGQWLLCLNITGKSEYTIDEIIKTHMIGLALRFFMPGGYATFGKIFYLDQNRKKDTFVSILIEKFFSNWIIIFTASLASLLFFDKWMILLTIFVVIVAFLPIFIPVFLKRFIKFEIIEEYYSTLPKIMINQIIYVLLIFLQHYLLLSTIMGIDLPFVQLSSAIALTLVANVIPITFSGLGLREIAYAMVLPYVGVPAEIAVGASLVIFLFNSVIPAIPGLYYIIRKKT